MKNKIFELYKPNSLAEFLELQKSNPDEKFVYVLQHPPSNINILGASDYGYLVICLPNYGPDSQIICKRIYEILENKTMYCSQETQLLLVYLVQSFVIKQTVNLTS
jgi:hypothetical protein